MRLTFTTLLFLLLQPLISAPVEILENSKLTPTEKSDSLYTLYSSFLGVDLDSAIFYSAKDLSFCKNNNLVNQSARALKSQGVALMMKTEVDSAIRIFNQSIQFYRKDGDSIGVAKNYINLSISYFKQYELFESEAMSEKALGIFEQEKDYLMMSKIYSNQATLYQHLNDQEEAIRLYKKALYIQNKIPEPNNFGALHVNLAIAYMNVNLPDSVLVSTKLAMSYFNEYPSVRHLGLAYAYQAFANYQKTDTLGGDYSLREAIKILNSIKYKGQELATCYLKKAELMLPLNLDSSKRYAQLVIETVGNKQYTSTSKSAYKILSQVYEQQGELAQSLSMLHRYTEFQELLLQQKEDKNYYRRIYEGQLKLNEERERLNFEKMTFTQKKNYTIIGIVGFLFLIFGSLFLLKQRKRVKLNRKEKKELLRTIKILKDGHSIKTKPNDSSEIKESGFQFNQLNIENINLEAQNKLNQTDLKIINELFLNPNLSNKELAEIIFLSPAGINSSLKKMYRLFKIEGNHKRISLITFLMKL